MTQSLILKKKISIGQKLSGTGSDFGDGFNYSVEAEFDVHGLDRAKASHAVQNALAKIDHRALGLDVDLGFEPTSANLCRFLFHEIAKGHPVARLTLLRGDGAIFSFGSSQTA